VVIHGIVPSFNVHLLCGLYALLAVVVGSVIYKLYNYRFVYYM
jgi:ABC-2 type transport system permease protein